MEIKQHSTENQWIKEEIIDEILKKCIWYKLK